MSQDNGKSDDVADPGAPNRDSPDGSHGSGSGSRLGRVLYDSFLHVFFEYPFLIPLGLIALVAELGAAVLNIATLPLHLDIDLNAAWAMGWALGAFLLVETAFKSPFGALGDRIGRKPLMILGPLWSGGCCYVMYHLDQPWQFIVLHGLNGLGMAALWPSCFSLIADRVGDKDRTVAMSVFNVTYMLGVAMGPLAKTLVGSEDVRAQLVQALARERVQYQDVAFNFHHPGRHLVGKAVQAAHHFYGTVASRIGETAQVARWTNWRVLHEAARHGITDQHRFPFLMVSLLFGLTAIIGVFLAPGRHPAAGSKTEGARQRPEASGADGHVPSGESLFRQIAIGMRSIPWMMLIAFLIFMGVGFVMPCMEPYVIRVYNVSEAQFSWMLMPAGAMIAVLAIPLGRLGDRWGTTRSIRLGMTACVIGLWLVAVQPLYAPRHGSLAILHSYWIMAILMGVVGLGFVIATPAWMARVSHMAPEQSAGAVLGAASMAQGAGALIGGVIGGYLWYHFQRVLPEAPVLGCATLLLIGTVITFLHVKEDPGSQPTEPLPPEKR